MVGVEVGRVVVMWPTLLMSLRAMMDDDPSKLVWRWCMIYTSSVDTFWPVESVTLHRPITSNAWWAGSYRVRFGGSSLSPLRAWKSCSEMTVTSVPLSILKWTGHPCTCTVIIHNNLSFSIRAPTNRVSSTRPLVVVSATVLDRHCDAFITDRSSCWTLVTCVVGFTHSVCRADSHGQSGCLCCLPHSVVFACPW